MGNPKGIRQLLNTGKAKCNETFDALEYKNVCKTYVSRCVARTRAGVDEFKICTKSGHCESITSFEQCVDTAVFLAGEFESWGGFGKIVTDESVQEGKTQQLAGEKPPANEEKVVEGKKNDEDRKGRQRTIVDVTLKGFEAMIGRQYATYKEDRGIFSSTFESQTMTDGLAVKNDDKSYLDFDNDKHLDGLVVGGTFYLTERFGDYDMIVAFVRIPPEKHPGAKYSLPYVATENATDIVTDGTKVRGEQKNYLKLRRVIESKKEELLEFIATATRKREYSCKKQNDGAYACEYYANSDGVKNTLRAMINVSTPRESAKVGPLWFYAHEAIRIYHNHIVEGIDVQKNERGEGSFR